MLFRSGSDRTVRPIGKLTGPDGRGYEYDALYKAAESGVYQIAMNDEFEEVLLVNLNNGKTKEPATSIEVGKGEYFASLVRRKGMIESSLIFDVTGDPSTTVSMSYVIQTHTRRISGQLSGIVPFRRNIESILVHEEDPSAQITFRAEIGRAHV